MNFWISAIQIFLGKRGRTKRYNSTALILFTFLCTGVKFDAGDIEVALLTHVNSASLTALDRQLCYQFIQWIVHVI